MLSTKLFLGQPLLILHHLDIGCGLDTMVPLEEVQPPDLLSGQCTLAWFHELLEILFDKDLQRRKDVLNQTCCCTPDIEGFLPVETHRSHLQSFTHERIALVEELLSLLHHAVLLLCIHQSPPPVNSS
jgi:hypothetical protein